MRLPRYPIKIQAPKGLIAPNARHMAIWVVRPFTLYSTGCFIDASGHIRRCERVHDEPGAWLVGRITGQEFCKGRAYPASTAETFPRQPWLAEREAKAYGRARRAG